jgi:hypothetical protein
MTEFAQRNANSGKDGNGGDNNKSPYSNNLNGGPLLNTLNNPYSAVNSSNNSLLNGYGMGLLNGNSGNSQKATLPLDRLDLDALISSKRPSNLVF